MASTLSAAGGSGQAWSHMLRYSSQGRCSVRTPRHSNLATTRTRCLSGPYVPSIRRTFASNSGHRPRFSQRLGEAMRNTKIQWYQIPVGLGIGFLGLVQFYKVSAREQEKQRDLEDGQFDSRAPKRRPRIRPDGPWYDFFLSPSRGPLSGD